jgi:hypothetical protein
MKILSAPGGEKTKPIAGLGVVSREESAAQMPGVFPIYV